MEYLTKTYAVQILSSNATNIFDCGQESHRIPLQFLVKLGMNMISSLDCELNFGVLLVNKLKINGHCTTYRIIDIALIVVINKYEFCSLVIRVYTFYAHGMSVIHHHCPIL